MDRKLPTDLSIALEGVAAQLPVKKLNYVVQQVTALSADIYQILLLPAETERLQYYAGQYLEILHQNQSPKPFSIANAPAADGMIELHIRHQMNNPYTQEIMDEICNVGQVCIVGPYGQNILRREPDYPIIFLAGGTGFAPIKALIEQALVNDLQQTLFLYWGIRNSSELYLAQLPQQWAKFMPHFHFIPVLSVDDSKHWIGRTGLVHTAVLQDHADLAAFQVYAAGPNEMVFAALRDFTARGLNRSLLYSDVFDKS